MPLPRHPAEHASVPISKTHLDLESSEGKFQGENPRQSRGPRRGREGSLSALRWRGVVHQRKMWNASRAWEAFSQKERRPGGESRDRCFKGEMNLVLSSGWKDAQSQGGGRLQIIQVRGEPEGERCSHATSPLKPAAVAPDDGHDCSRRERLNFPN